MKLAVALEVLRHLFLHQPDCPVQEFILPQQRFDKIAEKFLRPTIRDMLRETQVDEGAIGDICYSLRTRRFFGRFFAAGRQKLRAAAARLNVRRVGNLAGCPAP